MIEFSGERIVPEATNCEPLFAEKMYQEHVARYAFAAQWVKGKRVLDVGCGVGYGARWLAENGAASVLAFDLSDGAIGHASEFYAHPNVEYRVASATDFDFNEKFDVITCFELIEHVDDQEAVIKCIKGAIKDDGVLVISTPRALENKRTHFHTQEFSEEEFRNFLLRSFDLVHFYFENNHFSSLITDIRPSHVGRILPLKEQYTLAQADYFIAVATPTGCGSRISCAEPVLVLGDDSYVSLLERDVAILHRAEEEHVAKLSERDQQLLSLKEKLTEQNAKIEELNNPDRRIDTLNREIEILRSENARLRTIVAQSEGATRVEATNTDSEYSALRRQIELLQGDKLYLQDIVTQLHESTSWKITAPYRKLGQVAYRPLNLLKKAGKYQKQNGTRALLRAMKRRLVQSKASNMTTIVASDSVTMANRYFDVIYAVGCWEGESKRYRVYNLAEGLSARGLSVHIIPYERIAELADNNVRAKVVVLFRAPYDESSRVDIFLKYAKIRGIKVAFDVDDLVFEPAIIDSIDGVRMLSADEKRRYVEGVHAYRRLLLASDYVTVPTEYLRAQVEALGRPAYVIPNSINGAQKRVAAELATQRRVQDATTVRIGYFSGSRTHQADFAQCADALFEVMKAYPNVRLRLVGYLDLDERWTAYVERIERFGFQPHETMLRTLSECDINIASLELRSAFCQGKSELKFFEAGLLGIPTIASATDTYRRVIENGVNGFCVTSPAEWYAALETLIVSQEKRHSVGANAQRTALEHFSVDKVAEQAAAVYGLSVPDTGPTELDNPPTLPAGRLRIAWVVPGLIIGGGGHRNILRAAYFLSQFGHQISLYFVGTEQSPEVLKRQIQEHFYPLDCPVYLFEGQIKAADVVFATHWTTVSAALTARGAAKEIMYFVQDFEPAFAPMSTEYVLAENTYRLGLYHVTSGPWCEVILRRDYGADADHFQFPVDRSIYYPRVRTKENRNIVFFAKPEMPRRCFELGVMALREFHRLRPDVEIIMFGSKNAGRQNYDFPVTVRDVLPTLDDLAEMYSNGDVGLVFSTTNPSLIPYEMMACGLPVVDMDRGDNAVNYGSRTDIALLAGPLPEKMAEQIASLLGSVEELAARRVNGLAFVDQFPSEEEMARHIESLILRRLDAK